MIETDVLRAELERLFELDELVALSRDVLGFDPEVVGGTTAKGSFAGALTQHCVEHDAIEALCDALLASRSDVNAKILDLRVTGLVLEDELFTGHEFAGYTIARKLGEGRLALSYVAKKDGTEYRVKILRREATRDGRGLHRFLTINRLVSRIDHEGLPKQLSTALHNGQHAVIHEHLDGQPLSARIARTGPMHFNEARSLIEAILHALQALHERRLAHGDLRLDNIIVARGADGSQRVLLVDAGSDRLRARPRVSNGRSELFSTVGSPRTVAPEQIRGLPSDPRSDVYSFGAILYELLSGKSLFGDKSALDTAFAHLSTMPAAPSSVAPRGWIGKELDDLVLLLLSKDADRRPKNAAAVLAALDELGRATAPKREPLSQEALDAKVEALLAAPENEELAIELEAEAEAGEGKRIAEAFVMCADLLGADDKRDTKKDLLFRAARLFTRVVKDLGQAEPIYVKLTELDPSDQVAWSGLEDTRRKLGKHEELIEMLLLRSEKAESKTERSRAFAEIGRVYATDLDDKEQALVAFTQALCEDPNQSQLAGEIERLAGSNQQAWNDILSSVGEATNDENLAVEVKNLLLSRAGRWYEERLQRRDLALSCFQAVVQNDPANDAALEGMAQIYRKTQQWAELGMVLSRRADAAATPAQARNLRAEAAEILEIHINDTQNARALYEQVLAADPGHAKASEALSRIYERTGDHANLVKILERKAEALRGEDKAKALCRIAEVFETQLTDDSEAIKRYTQVLGSDAKNADALRGLDRIYSKLGRFQDLLANLEQQVAAAATPRQKISLFERIAAIYEEEFLDARAAASALEKVIELDGSNENALTALTRHYRTLERWEDVAALYERHLKLINEPGRKVGLILLRAKVLADNIGSPDRATAAYEQILAIDPQHADALEALARLRESTGDAGAALAAIDALAAKATTPEAKAEQYVRAAKLLEARGDRDAAIDRYKQALDANPKDLNAAAALREAYTARGDVNSALQLLEREFSQTEGDRAKAKLAGQMAALCRNELMDDKRAEEAGKRALAFDPTNLDALLVLGDIAFENKRFIEASKHYEAAAGRAESLEKKVATRMLVRYVDALSQTGSTEKALVPMDTLIHLAPDDAEALERVAHVTFEHGAPKRAAELYAELLKRFNATLNEQSRARCHYRYGEALRKSGSNQAAVEPLEEAADLDPASPDPLVSLAKAYEALENWEQVIKVKNRHLDIALGDERVQILIDIGDTASQKLKDRARATKSFVAALEEHPDDRRLLTKLMQLYSEEKDWNKLVDVVIRLAEFVDDPKQKVKYLHTAAIVEAQQVGDIDKALGFYEQVLDLEPDMDRALSEAVGLERGRSNWEGVERLLRRRLQAATKNDDKKAMLESFVELGELYEKNLGWTDQAVDAYEAAQTLDPDNKERNEHLSSLYATDPAKYLEKAVTAQMAMLRQNPFRAESYKTLRRLYTETKQADASWCLCQALTVLNLAEPDEERFYKRMRSESAAPAQAALSDEDWLMLLMHPGADPLLTSVFALIETAVIAKRSKTPEELGYDPAYAIEVSTHIAPVCQSLYYAAGVMGMTVPPAYQNPNDPGGLSFLFAYEPSLVLGQTALRTDVPLQPAAFIAGQQLAYFRPGLYIRHLLASGTALKSWLFAAIKLTAPQFPISPEIEGAVNDAMQALDAGIQGQARDHLTRVVSKLLTSGAALDLKRWVQGVDLTADRIGMVLAHDLETSVQIIRASDEASSSVPAEERVKELVLYAVSEPYLQLRRRLAIAVDS